MDTADVIKHFGSKIAIARALGIRKQAVSAWGEKVPEGRDYQLEVITGGALKVDGNAGHTDHDAEGEKPAAVPEGAE